jgi:hypothetical protein
LENRPELYQDLYGVWDAWLAMDAGRAPGRGIAVSEVLAYCQLLKLHRLEERDALLRWVRVLDKVYLELWDKRHGNNLREAR